MWVLNIAGMAIIFALVRSTTSSALGQRRAAKPYENPSGYARPATRPTVIAPPIYKRPHYVSTSRGPQASSPHPHGPEHFQPVTAPDQPGTEENPVSLVMTGDMIEDNLMASKQDQTNIHQPITTGVTSTMSGQPSLPDSTETMTDDHPEHPHQPPPVVLHLVDQTNIHQPVTTGVTSEEPPMTPAMTEDIAIMPSEELTNATESNEVMTEEMSEHDQMIPVHDEMISVHEFKEVLHEIVQDAVDKILTKKAGIVEKLITAKQNLIGHDGEVSGREFQAMDACLCDQDLFDRRGRGDCNFRTLDFNGRKWCFLETFSFCHDEVASRQFPGRFWSHAACSSKDMLN